MRAFRFEYLEEHEGIRIILSCGLIERFDTRLCTSERQVVGSNGKDQFSVLWFYLRFYKKNYFVCGHTSSIHAVS
nr:hypothetical protein [Granulicella arctica]